MISSAGRGGSGSASTWGSWLPSHTAFARGRLLEQVAGLDREVDLFEQRMRVVFKPTPEVALLMTLPGVGFILAVVIALEMGDVTRFASPEKCAAYAGTTPPVHASGGKTRYGPLRSDVNHYRKWAFVVPEMGLRGSRQRDLSHARAPSPPPCQPPL